MEELDDIINTANESSNTPPAKDPLSELISQSNDKSMGTDKSNIVGYNTGIGDSKYDEGFLPNMSTNMDQDFRKDLDDYRSKKQSVTNKVVKGVGRVGSKVAIELLKIPGYLGGASAAPFADDNQGMDTFVNNSWIQAVERLEGKINEDVLPVYVKKAVRDGNLWDNVSSIDFWANEGADGLGFMGSMMIPGAGLSKLGLGGKLLSGLGKSKRGISILTKLDDAAKVLGLENAGKAIDLGTSTMVNTLFEAGSEANGAMKSAEINLKKKVDAGEMTQEQADVERARIGRDVFVSNVAILVGPNLLLNKQLMGSKKIASQVNNKYKVVGGDIVENIDPNTSLLSKVWNSKATSILAKDVPREAMEELSQSTVEKYWSHNKEFDAAKLFETMLDVSKTTDGQKAMLLGGLFGGLGGGGGAIMESRRDKSRTNAIMESMNNSISYHEKAMNGFIKKDTEGNVILDSKGAPTYDYGKLADYAKTQTNIEAINVKLEQAKEQGDTVAYNLIKDRLDAQLVNTFAKAGEDGLSILKDRLLQSEDFEQSLNESNKELNQNVNKEQAVNDILDKANATLKDYEFFQSYGKVLNGFKVDKANKGFYDNFMANMSDAYLETASQIRQVKKEISTLNDKRNELLTDLEIDEREDDFLLINLDQDIKILEEYKETQKKKRKDMLSSKVQKEAFNSLLAIHKEETAIIEESEEKAATSPTVEEEEQAEEIKQEVKETFKKEKETAAKVEVAKNSSNDFYNDLEEVYDNPDVYDVNKDINTGWVTNPFQSDKPGALLGKHLEAINEADAFSLNKVLNDEGVEVFEIKTFKGGQPTTIRVEKFNTKEKDVQTSSDEVNLTSDDNIYDPTDNVNSVAKTTVKTVVSETNDVEPTSVRKKHVKTVVSKDPLMTSPLFMDYLVNPTDKKGEKVTFDLGYTGTNELAKEAVNLYNTIISNDYSPTSDNKEFLIKHLPIKITLKEDVFTHLFNEDGSGKYLLDQREIDLRKTVVDNILANKSFESVSSEVKFQFPGKLQLDAYSDGKPAVNSLLEVSGINSLEDIEIIYSDKEFRMKGLDQEVDSRFNNAKHKGHIFMVVPMANGRKFPLKLNQRRINEAEADLITTLVSKMLNRESRLQYKDKIVNHMETLQLTPDNLEVLKIESNALGKKHDLITLGDIISGLVFDGNSVKNKFKLNGNILEFGGDTVTSENFENKIEDIKKYLTTEKNRNIRVDLMDEQIYKKHVIENILSTDVKLGEPIFQGNTDLFIDSNITENKSENTRNSQEKNVSLQDSKVKALKKSKTKARGKKLGSLKKGLNQMKKDNNQNSNTIC